MTAATGPAHIALAFAQLFCEVEAGRRPRWCVERYLSPRAAERIRPLWVRGGRPRQVIRVRGCRVTDHIYEAAVTVRGTRRTGILMVRLERRPDGWQITEVGRPEDGVLPEPILPEPLAELDEDALDDDTGPPPPERLRLARGEHGPPRPSSERRGGTDGPREHDAHTGAMPIRPGQRLRAVVGL